MALLYWLWCLFPLFTLGWFAEHACSSSLALLHIHDVIHAEAQELLRVEWLNLFFKFVIFKSDTWSNWEADFPNLLISETKETKIDILKLSYSLI